LAKRPGFRSAVLQGDDPDAPKMGLLEIRLQHAFPLRPAKGVRPLVPVLGAPDGDHHIPIFRQLSNDVQVTLVRWVEPSPVHSGPTVVFQNCHLRFVLVARAWNLASEGSRPGGDRPTADGPREVGRRRGHPRSEETVLRRWRRSAHVSGKERGSWPPGGRGRAKLPTRTQCAGSLVDLGPHPFHRGRHRAY